MRTVPFATSRDVVRVVLVGGVTLGLLLALYEFRFLILVAAIGVIGGVLLMPAIDTLRRACRVPRGAAVAIVALLVLGLLGGGFYGLWALISGQVRDLAARGPAISQGLIETAQRWADRIPGLGIDLKNLELGSIFQRGGQAALKAVHIGAEGLAGVLVVLMIALFVAGNREAYQRGALTLLPPRARPRGAEVMNGCATVIRRWFTGQLLVMAITSAMTAVALGFLRVDYWIVIALLTGLLDFIPFVGAFITGALAVGITLGTQPEKAGWVLLAYIVIQQLESDVVAPLVMKGRIQLPEAHLLVFVLLMGMGFGLLGVFAAPALFGVVHYLYNELYVPWIEERDVSRKRFKGSEGLKPSI